MFLFFLPLISCKTEKSRVSEQSTEVSLSLQDSLFKNIASDENGGAISILKCTGSLELTQVLFDTCTTTSEGGCIYIKSPTFECIFTKVGSVSCKASRFSHFAHLEYSGDVTNTLNSITKCGAKEGSIVFKTKYVETLTMSNLNYSQTRSTFKYALSFEGKCTFEFVNVQDNNCFNYITVGKGLNLTTANFVNNTAINRHLVTVAQTSTFTNCFFKGNSGYVMHYGLLTMDYCYLDGTEIRGKLNKFIHVNTNTEVFPTNFNVYTDDGIESVPYVGEQSEATVYPDPSPLPTPTIAATPYPTATPIPEEEPEESLSGLFLSQLNINEGLIEVKSAIFVGLTSVAIKCKNVNAKLDLLEVTFYDIQGSSLESEPGGALIFETVDDNSCYSHLDRICCVMARARNGAFGSIKPGTNADSHSNLTTLSFCTNKIDYECYNTVECRRGNKVFDSWNSSKCYTTDTCGIFTMSYERGHTSYIKFATFAHNCASRAMVLNSEQETLTYSYMNIINNSCTRHGALILMFDTVLYLKSSIILDNKITYLLSKVMIGYEEISTITEFHITDCYVQDSTKWGKEDFEPDSMDGTERTTYATTRVLTHFAHVLCQVPVSKAPLEPEPTYPTRCLNVQVTKNKGVKKTKVTKVGMSLAPSVLSDFI